MIAVIAKIASNPRMKAFGVVGVSLRAFLSNILDSGSCHNRIKFAHFCSKRTRAFLLSRVRQVQLTGHNTGVVGVGVGVGVIGFI